MVTANTPQIPHMVKAWAQAVDTSERKVKLLSNITPKFPGKLDIHDWIEPKHDCKPFRAAAESPDAKETYS